MTNAGPKHRTGLIVAPLDGSFTAKHEREKQRVSIKTRNYINEFWGGAESHAVKPSRGVEGAPKNN